MAESFSLYQTVKVVMLEHPNRHFDGTPSVLRAPRVGDIGVICFLYDSDDASAPVIVECVDSDGMTLWLADFLTDEIKLADCVSD